ncbi:unnamed protein product, partial [Musa acuminata var. zebrina]
SSRPRQSLIPGRPPAGAGADAGFLRPAPVSRPTPTNDCAGSVRCQSWGCSTAVPGAATDAEGPSASDAAWYACFTAAKARDATAARWAGACVCSSKTWNATTTSAPKSTVIAMLSVWEILSRAWNYNVHAISGELLQNLRFDLLTSSYGFMSF